MAKPRDAPRLSVIAKKKSEPADRIRQLMESLQAGGGKNSEPKAHAFSARQSTSTEDSTPRVAGHAVESPPASVTDDSRQEETEQRKQGINRAHFLSNDGLHAIDDEPEEEKVCFFSACCLLRAVLLCGRGHTYHTKNFKRRLRQLLFFFRCAFFRNPEPSARPFDVVHPVAIGSALVVLRVGSIPERADT